MTTSRQPHEASEPGSGVVVTSDATCPVPVEPKGAIGLTVDENVDEMRIPVLAEELRASARPDAAGPVRIQRRMVSEGTGGATPEGREEIRVSRQFVTRPGANGEAVWYEQIAIELPLPDGVTPNELEAEGVEQIIVTHEIVERTERITGTVRREEVTVSGRYD